MGRWKDEWPLYEGEVRVVGECGEARYGWACAEENADFMCIIMDDTGERELHEHSMAYRRDRVSELSTAILEYVEAEVSLNGSAKLGSGLLPEDFHEVKAVVRELEKTFNVGPIQSEYIVSQWITLSYRVRILSRK